MCQEYIKIVFTYMVKNIQNETLIYKPRHIKNVVFTNWLTYIHFEGKYIWYTYTKLADSYKWQGNYN